MNERIKELAEQAGFENGHQDRYGNSLSYELEKFAELIVRECMNVAVNKDAGISYTADVAGYVAAGRSNAARAIKQHFGIEL
jgi:hypothetical protein